MSESNKLSRRGWIGLAGAGLAGAVMSKSLNNTAEAKTTTVSGQSITPVKDFTGPGPNTHWNSVGPYVSYPQKSPLLMLTDRPIQLETPRHFFLTPFTPNHAFFVRWHLDGHPTAVDLAKYRLKIGGHVNKGLSFSMADLMTKFPRVSVAAVNQCSGNSRSTFQPRVAGGQWGNGAMGCAMWEGVRVMDLLKQAGLKKGALQVQFQAMDRGKGPKGKGSYAFLKSLDLSNDVLKEAILAYSMNGEPLPLLNGFPLRLIVPGYFSTYWVKAVEGLKVLDKPDENFWMKKAYHVPDNARGATTPKEVAAGKLKKVPISRMPVRSFLISPDGSGMIPAHMPVTLRGIAFSGHGEVRKVEVSLDNGKTWKAATLDKSHGDYAFRVWHMQWTPKKPGSYTIAVRATDKKGHVQPDSPIWNPGGYMRNQIERQVIIVGESK
ncbi:MAG: twin-arginine translocation pathway signal protein [Deltaproteobacteria bacterium]|nr:twin-arginine translocation pathway signal protein [Deltaproteobacteria bacterium]MBU53035.1 twin-arginine translocation pathway signal protein [Deltaproteobacteria bacterium]|tara:strand:+ start:893 stop:2197 length:1305 start_codon:yes stop_codon:yes gene_type:complete